MTLNQKLALGAGTLAALALILGSRTPRSSVDLDALARAVEAEEDHVTALELADWLRAQKAHLRIVDVRARADYDRFHVPRAEHVALGRILDFKPDPNDTIVLYSDGGTHAAQAWFFLRASGLRHVYFLRGGLNEWFDQVINPAPPIDAHTRELMNYFGGSVSDRPAGESLDQRVARVKKRTC
jgi:rhodanese-related sulfurtransferase